MNNKMKFKNAFTLAEILIVITIIGIVVSMLLPLAKHVIPDKEVMKFKKANNAFVSAIRELANSDKYFTPGDFGLKKDGSLVSDPKQFCNALADVLATKSVNCSDVGSANLDSTALANILPSQATFVNDGSVGVRIYEQADCMCRTKVASGAEIITSDGVTIYTVNPKWHFGSKIPGYEKRLFNLCSEQERYKYYCIDIDGIGEGEDPFGYAVRADGKVFLGSRAQAWMERDIQQDEDGYTNPYSIATCPDTSLSDIKAEEDSFDGCKPFPCGDEKIMAKIEIDGEDYCMTKYNMGKEASYTVSVGIQTENAKNLELPEKLNLDVGVNATCPSKESKCCWGEDTQTSYGARPNNNSNKTVCTFNAAKEICSKYTYLEKDWKLPTNEQMSEIMDQQIEGLNFCSNDSNNDSYCSGGQFCYGNYGSNWCGPSSTWAVGSSDDTIAYLAGYQTVSLGNNVSQTSSLGFAASVRCIAKVDSYREPVVDPCDGVTCPENSICIKTGDESAICMMQYNIGRDTSTALGISVGQEWFSSNYHNMAAQRVHLDMAGCTAFCEISDNLCCLTYATGYTNSSVSSQYTLTDRTVCNYSGGGYLCSSFGWRLPTEEELNAIAEQIKDDSSDLGPTKNLLQLCSEDPSDSFPHCGTVAGAMNTDSGFVDSIPGQILGASGNKVLQIWTREVTSGGGLYKPHSVRCVSDATNYKN